jgi:hypothetical protein
MQSARDLFIVQAARHHSQTVGDTEIQHGMNSPAGKY